MKTYSAKDYGIIPNKQIAKPLYDLFCELQKTDLKSNNKHHFGRRI